MKYDGREQMDGGSVYLGLHKFDVFMWKFEANSKGYEGGSVGSSLLASYMYNKWWSWLASNGNGGSEIGVYVKLFCCKTGYWKHPQ